jgi:hypothetical protein
MILSTLDEIADATTVTFTADTEAVVGNVIPLGSTLAYGGSTNFPTVGRPLYCTIRVNTAFAGTNADVLFAIKSGTNVDLVSDSPTTHWITPTAIPVATLVAGYTVFQGALPLGEYQDYLGVTTLPDETLTAGKLDIFITDDVTKWRAYADALANS